VPRYGGAIWGERVQRDPLGASCSQDRNVGGQAPRSDRRSKRIEAHHDFIMETIRDRKDVTLAELQELLVKRRRARFGIGTLWRFFDRHGITVKKRRRMPTNSNGPTS